MDGRRKSRTQVSLVARYRSPTVFDFVEEQCFDLSEGGMFIKSTAPAPTGTLLKIECAVGGGKDVIAGIARVVWLRQEDGADGPRGMGVKFVKLEDGSSQVIAAVIAAAGNSIPPGAVSAPPPAPAPVAVPVPANTNAQAPAAATAAAATTVPAAAPSGPDPSSKRSKKSKKSKGGSRSATAAEPSAPTPTSAASTKAAAPVATASSKPAGAPSTPTAKSEPGIPVIVWFVAAAAIVAIIVLSQSGDAPESQPTIDAEPTAAAVEQPAAEPTPQATTPEPAAVAPAVVEPAVVEPAVVEPPAVEPAAVVAPAAVEAAVVAPVGKPYVVDVKSVPVGATVTAAGQTCVAPCSLRFDQLATPVMVDATLPKHAPTNATLDARTGFTERGGSFHRTLFLRLNPERGTAGRAAATPRTTLAPRANDAPADSDPPADTAPIEDAPQPIAPAPAEPPAEAAPAPTEAPAEAAPPTP